MTLSTFVTKGGGKGEFSLQIEGLPEVFVTARSMAGALSDGRTRIEGLKIDVDSGTVVGSRSQIADGTVEGDSVSFYVVDVDTAGVKDRVTQALTAHPTVRQYLTITASDSDTILTVMDSSPFVVGEFYSIGTEVIEIVDIPDVDQIEVNRARWGTLAQWHYVTVGDELTYPEIVDRFTLFQGRRIKVFFHSPTELTTSSSGTQVWAGIIEREPQDDGMGFTIQTKSLDSILDQEVAQKINHEFTISGIYYAWTAPLYIMLQECSGSDPGSGPSYTAVVVLSGWFRSNDTFCQALQAKLDAATAGWSNKWYAEPDPVYGWILSYRTQSPSPRWGTAIGGSLVDGALDSEIVIRQVDGTVVTEVLDNEQFVIGWGAPTAEGMVFTGRWDRRARGFGMVFGGTPTVGLRSVPRAQLVGPNDPTIRDAADLANASTAPQNRIYLDRADLLTTDDQIMIGANGPYDVATASAGGYVDLEVDGIIPTLNCAWLGTENQWTVRAVRYYGDGPTTLAGFISALLLAAPKANQGSTPFTVSSDWGDYTTAILETALFRPYVARRIFAFSKPMKLRDVIAEECKLAGVGIGISEEGKLFFFRLAIASPTEYGTFAVTDANRIARSPAIVNPCVDGVINTIVIKDGYDIEEDKHARTIGPIREVRSISSIHKQRELEIAPFTQGEIPIDYMTAVQIAWPILTVFSSKYGVIVIDIDSTGFYQVAGDNVTITIPKRGGPAWNGVRGLTSEPGIIIGRKWDLGKMSGQWDVQLHAIQVAGYTPAARIESQVNTSGNTWNLTVGDPDDSSSDYYAPDGTSDASTFIVGDKVEVRVFDSSSSTPVKGTVSNVSGNVITVIFDSAWTPGASTWNLHFQCYQDASATQQGKWAFEATSTGVLPGTTLPAKVFSA